MCHHDKNERMNQRRTFLFDEQSLTGKIGFFKAATSRGCCTKVLECKVWQNDKAAHLCLAIIASSRLVVTNILLRPDDDVIKTIAF